MHRYRNILAIISLCLLIFTFFSCAEADEGGFLRVLESPAKAEIAGVRNGVEFAAIIEFASGEGKITFGAPDSMKGITVSTAGGVWGSNLGDIKLSGIASERLGAPIKIFTDCGEVIFAEKCDEGTLIRTRSGDVAREYLIDSKSGLPLKIKEMSADGALIMDIEIKTYTIKEENDA